MKIEANSHKNLALDFPLSGETFSRKGEDLVISFDNGGQIVLRDFYLGHWENSLKIDGKDISPEAFFDAMSGPDIILPVPAPGWNEPGRSC